MRIPVTAFVFAGLAALTPSVTNADPPLYSTIIQLERCIGGCMVNPGPNDPHTITSQIPQESSVIPEFTDEAGNTGTAADAEWNALVACVTETFSPYAVTITTQEPAANLAFNLAVVAGASTDLGLQPGVIGISPAAECAGGANYVSFTFPTAIPAGSQRLNKLCAAVAQSVAISFGLDHLLAFQDGRQACTDPMAWDGSACGGQRYFRNAFASCGEISARPCICGSTAINPHARLLEAFGPGLSTTPPPTSVVTLPTPGGTLGAVVAVSAGSRRGIDRIELVLNGHVWAEVKGALFRPDGQPDPSSYTIPLPGGVPDSVLDIVARAFDDSGSYTDSDVVTVTKGAPCESADTCAAGQQCEQGKCFWDPPSGELGDACTFTEFCVSGMCLPNGDGAACTQSCIMGAADSCPAGFACVAAAGGEGFCFLPATDDAGGCCSTGGGGGNAWLGCLVAALWVLRRRERGTARQSRDS